MKAVAASLALLTLLALAVACGGSPALEPRYRHFSAKDATLDAADLPPGWQLLPAKELPSLEDFFPETADLADSALVVASNGEDDPARLQLVAVGVALLGGEIEPTDPQGVAGLALRAAFAEIDLPQLTFISADTVDSPKPQSKRLNYSAAIDGLPLTTEAINLRDGRVFADIEVVRRDGSDPDVDLDELAALVYGRISRQLETRK